MVIVTVEGGFRWDEDGVFAEFREGLLQAADSHKLGESVQILRLGQFEQVLGPVRQDDVVDQVDDPVVAQHEVVADAGALDQHALGVALQAKLFPAERAHSVFFNNSRRAKGVYNYVVL